MLGALTLQLSYPLAFLAGLASFLSPCVFPLVPAYMAFLGGSAAADVGQRGTADARRSPLPNGVAFVLGFSAVFVTFFYVFSALDVTLLRNHQRAVNVVGGAIVIVLALEVLGLIRIGFLLRERRLSFVPSVTGTGPAFLLGVAFAAGWTPCIGPQLAAVLTVAAQHDFSGLPVMLVYCLGLAAPFLLVAGLTERLQGALRAINRHLGVINLAGGAVLLIFGLLLVTDHFTVFNRFAAQPPFDL